MGVPRPSRAESAGCGSRCAATEATLPQTRRPCPSGPCRLTGPPRGPETRGLRIRTSAAEGSRELTNAGRQIALADRQRPDGTAIPQHGQRDQREGGPPDSCRGEVDPHELDGVPPQTRRGREEPEIQRQQEAAAKIPEGPAPRRDGVAVANRCDIGKEGIVEDHRGAEAHVGDTARSFSTCPRPGSRGARCPRGDGPPASALAEYLFEQPDSFSATIAPWSVTRTACTG